ncbi:hypothetical protein SHVI106290_08880 [Shewanella violacea]
MYIERVYTSFVFPMFLLAGTHSLALKDKSRIPERVRENEKTRKRENEKRIVADDIYTSFVFPAWLMAGIHSLELKDNCSNHAFIWL